MSTTHSVRAGDSYASLARRYYGDDTRAAAIRSANPGVSDPPTVGAVLLIPDQPAAPVDRLQATLAATPDEVAVLINGIRFRYWTQIRVTVALDSMATVELSAPFDPNDQYLRETFRPFTYPSVVVTVGGTPLFTGTLVSSVPAMGSDSVTIAVGAYATPGVLGDCTPPASAFPLEFIDASLPDIAAQLCEPFGITVQFTSAGGAPFEQVACEPGQNILDFLTGLAKQRGLVLSSTSAGALVFQKSPSTGQPVAILRQGSSPVLSVAPFFSPQAYYSHITGVDSVMVGSEGSQFTVKNPHARALRPHTFRSPDTEGGDVQESVSAKAGRMFAGVAQYQLKIATWRNPSGGLWLPGDTVQVFAPQAMIYAPYNFLTRSVAFFRDENSTTAELDLVLPGAFSGQMPETLPWEG